jgi:homoserine/homoserine lactone efflux protein
LGLAFHILLVGIGVGAFVAQSVLAFSLIKWIGVAYLVWLGIQKWRDTSMSFTTESQTSHQPWVMLRKSMLINLTNPKSIVFLVALFPQFIQPESPQMSQLIILGVTTMLTRYSGDADIYFACSEAQAIYALGIDDASFK